MALKEFELGTQGTSIYVAIASCKLIFVQVRMTPRRIRKSNSIMLKWTFPKPTACSTSNQFKNYSA